MLSKFKSLKKLAALSAIATMCGFAKAEEKEFTPVGNDGEISKIEMAGDHLLVTSNGKIGNIDTPYFFVSTNGLDKGFTLSALTNANAVVYDSEKKKYYASTKDGKILGFTINQDTIPSSQVIDYEIDSDVSAKQNGIQVMAAKSGKVYATSKSILSELIADDSTKKLTQNTWTSTGGTPLFSDCDGESIGILTEAEEAYKFPLSNIKDHSDLSGTVGGITPNSFKFKDNNFYVSTKTNALNRIDGEIYSVWGNNRLRCLSDEEKDDISMPTGVKKVVDKAHNSAKLIYAKTRTLGVKD